MKNLTLISGGVRSGKSLFAESLASTSGLPVVYIATMPTLENDAEQQTRIERHRSRRPPQWQTIEAPYTLPEVLQALPSDPVLCLIDCLSVYVSNLILGDNPDAGPAEPYEQESKLFGEIDKIVAVMQSRTELNFVMVTNEVGWGVVPDNVLSRAYRDFLGLSNQTMAQQAESVWLMCSGIPVKIKPQGPG